MRAILTLLVSVALVVALALQAGESPYVTEKAVAVRQAIQIVERLASIAEAHSGNYPEATQQATIREFLKPLKTVDDLTRFALLASAIAGGQLAEHQRYDGVFDYATWACVYRIASIPGEEAHDALEHFLRPVLGRDGHASEEFAELITKQKQLSAR